jgi:AcrR family transcriptional regulator
MSLARVRAQRATKTAEATVRAQSSPPSPNEAAAAKPRRPYLPAKQRRQLIIEAAQLVFSKTNLQGARTRDIAKAAAINPATLFEHFESKEALFHEAVVEPLLEAMRGMHDRAQTYEAASTLAEMRLLGQASARRQLEIMMEIFPLFTAALFSDLELGKKLYREQILPILAQRSAAIRRLVKPTLDAELVELAMFGIVFALAMDRTLGGRKRDLAVLAEQLTAIAVTGFAREHGED